VVGTHIVELGRLSVDPMRLIESGGRIELHSPAGSVQAKTVKIEDLSALHIKSYLKDKMCNMSMDGVVYDRSKKYQKRVNR